MVDQHTQLAFYSVSSMQQQSAGRHVAPSQTLSWFQANQSLLLVLYTVCIAAKQQIPIL